ncbi:translocation/assembly module TamB domain-containing protein [Loktanella sp. TSTF-M6]|uniref:Translocation/assembly module TamB domain-containing protein n=2 Tax=Loktanella gaetbuli TaxID=2881335 RepID=A0ABS8BV49_9RHOB|nr:translocation/assembly module TamB domain-containing protein [Loktanella gaetbuli]MCB5199608.1 translocation/assembly module TamB domain-containing protein [Loktanella gaetbuli]
MKKYLVFATLAALPFAATAQDEEGEGYLTRLIQDNLSGDDRIVDIQGFEGALSSEATVARITVADSDGVWLTLEDVTLDWNRSALLRGRIDVQELSAALIRVDRAPITPPSENIPDAEAQPFSLPELPVSIQLDSLDIARIELGEPLIGEALALSLTGSASLAGGEGSANVTANRLDGQTGIFDIAGSYDNETRNVGLNLRVEEGEDGLIATRAGIPGAPSLLLTLQGDAPLSAFAADLTLATSGQPRITGNFALDQTDSQTGFALNIGGDVTPLLAPDYQGFFGTDVALVATGAQADDGSFFLSDLDLRAQKLNLQGEVRVDADGWAEFIDLTGTVADTTGDSVLLPIGGPKTYVDNVDLSIQFDQSLGEDWTASFDINGFDRPGLGIDAITLDGGGTIRAESAADAGLFTADLQYRADGVELDDAGAAQAFGDALTGQIVVLRDPTAPIEIPTLTLNGPGIELDAEATIDTSGDTPVINTQLNFDADAIQRFSTLAGRDLGGAARATITAVLQPLDGMFDINIDAATDDLAVDVAQLDPILAGAGTVRLSAVRDTEGTRLPNLRIETPEALITGRANLTSAVSTGDFDVSLRNLGLVVAGLDGPANVTGTADRAADGNVTFDVQGQVPETTFAATGTVAPFEDTQRVNAVVNLQADDLSVFRQISNQDLSGAVDLAVDASLLADLTNYSADITGSMQDVQTGFDQVDPLLVGAGSLRGTVGYTGDATYRVQDLDLQTPQLSLTGDALGGLTGPAEADIALRLTDVGLVVDGLAGPLAATITGNRDASEVANLILRAQGPGVDLDADVQIAAPQDDYRIAGRIAAEVPDLAPYAALAGQDAISGGIDLVVDGTLLPDLSAVDVTLNGTTQDITAGIAQVDQLMAGAGRISGGVARTGPDSFALNNLDVATPQFTLSGSGSGGLTGPLNADITAILRDAGTLAQGLNGALTLDLTADRDSTGTAQIDLTARGSGTDVAVDATVAPQEDDYRITATVDAAIAQLSQFAALAGQPISGGLSVNAAATLMPDLSTLDVQARAQTRQLAIGNSQVDQLLAGTGNLTVDASKDGADITVRSFDVQFPQITASGALEAGPGGSAAGQIQARLANVGLFTDVLSGPVTAQGQVGRTAGGDFTLDIDATGPGGIQASADGTVAAGGNLNLDANGQVPLGLANTFITPRSLDGIATFNLSVNGPPALTSVSGQIATGGARLSLPSLSESLENITGRIALDGQSAQIDMTTEVGTGGTLTLTGPVALTGGYNADLGLALRAVRLRDPNLYEAILNGRVTVQGPLAGGAVIGGDVQLSEANIQVPSSGVGGLGELPEVRHLNPDAAVRQTLNRADVAIDGGDRAAAETGGGGPVYPLALTITAPNQIFVRGRGLDAELGGQLALGGTTANIIPVGQFDLIRGRISILQQRFDLTEGSATLQGDFLPYLRLVAATETDNGTVVRIVVEGPANDPEVSFESVPDLPQDEVLSQLIFGRDLSEISPLQAVQLAAAVGELAGRGGGGLIDGFRANLGLDDFDVTTDAEGNAALRAGKYLSDNLYTDVTIGSDGSTEINLNLDITSEITAKGTAGADGETSIGIFFERDY